MTALTRTDVDEAEAVRIVMHLRKVKKYVVEAPGSHSKGFSQTGRPRYILTNDESVREAMIRDLFNPMTHIEVGPEMSS